MYTKEYSKLNKLKQHAMFKPCIQKRINLVSKNGYNLVSKNGYNLVSKNGYNLVSKNVYKRIFKIK